jgi:hypothetical protein
LLKYYCCSVFILCTQSKPKAGHGQERILIVARTPSSKKGICGNCNKQYSNLAEHTKSRVCYKSAVPKFKERCLDSGEQYRKKDNLRHLEFAHQKSLKRAVEKAGVKKPEDLSRRQLKQIDRGEHITVLTRTPDGQVEPVAPNKIHVGAKRAAKDAAMVALTIGGATTLGAVGGSLGAVGPCAAAGGLVGAAIGLSAGAVGGVALISLTIQPRVVRPLVADNRRKRQQDGYNGGRNPRTRVVDNKPNKDKRS